MSPLVFAVVCLASMTVLGGTEEQPIRLEQGLLVLFHTVLVLQITARAAVVWFGFSPFTLHLELCCTP